MKYLIHHIALAVAMLASMAACSDNTPDADIDADDLRVAFVISIDGELTRASDGWDDYSPIDNGTAAESAINPADIYIKICDARGRVVGNVDDVSMSRLSRTQYAITGSWEKPGTALREARKVMILANCGSEASTNDIANISFDIADTQKYLPMWGVGSIASLTLGKSNNIGSIALLRATAKVGVELRSDMTERGYSIGALRIEGYNTRGYSLPLKYGQVAKTENLKFDDTLHPLDSKATEPLDFTKAGFCYIPEWDNTSTSATQSSIVVDLLKDGVHEGTYRLRFCLYEDGVATSTLYDIQRNHYYRFNIYKEDDHIMVALHVRRWYWREHDDVIM